MVGASKILTVSYGTFSCTLEGFDEPFSTMKAIAEYFRDLAADDRYFGAEPPTPDAEMLHRIAEREIQRRVEAKINENGIVLRPEPRGEADARRPAPRLATVTSLAGGTARTADRTSPSAPASEPERASPATASTPADDMVDEDLDESVPEAPSALDDIDPNDDSIAAKLLRIRAAVAGERVAPKASFEDDQIGDIADAAAAQPEDFGFDLDLDALSASRVAEDVTPEEATEKAEAVADLPEEIAEAATPETVAETPEDAVEAIAEPEAVAEPEVSAEPEAEVTEAETAETVAAVTDETEILADDDKPVAALAEAIEQPVEVAADDEAEAEADETATVEKLAEDMFAEDKAGDAALLATLAETDAEPVAGEPLDEGYDDAEMIADLAALDGFDADADVAEDDTEDTVAATDPSQGNAGSDFDDDLAAISAAFADDAEAPDSETVADAEDHSDEAIAAAMADDETDVAEADEAEVDAAVAEDEAEPVAEADKDAAPVEALSAEGMADEDLAAVETAGEELVGEEPVAEELAEDETVDAVAALAADAEEAEYDEDYALDADDADEAEDGKGSVADRLLRFRARVIKVGRHTAQDSAASDTTAQDEPVELDEAALRAALGDDPQVEATATELADTAANEADDDSALLSGIGAAIGETGLSAEDEADLVAELAKATRDSERHEGRAILEGTPTNDEASVERLMEEAKTKLDGPENRRRFSAIAHLKAAVAATVADRKMKSTDAPTGAAATGPTPMDRFRDDLSKAVRPRRPEADGGATTARPSLAQRPSPLVLVSEQRVDRRSDDTSAPNVVRPRRISANHVVAPAAVDPEDEDMIVETQVSPEDARDFADFAEQLGANGLSELLEAAAAYTAKVEGRPHFSRPHILNKIAHVADDTDYSREDGLRSFGMLLRQGKIQKIRRGQFALADNSRFYSEVRSAG
jgi:hypothetical protein